MNRDFYTDRAKGHGDMALYYAKQITTGKNTDGDALSEFSIDWAIEHVILQSREAWHYALLMTPGQVEAELVRIEAELLRQIPESDLEF